MPSIQGIHNGKAVIVTIAIIDAAKYKEHKEAGAPIIKGVQPLRALVDTGATSSMIATRVVTQLGLQQVTKRQYACLGGVIWRPAYLFHVAFYEETPGQIETPSKIHTYRKAIIGGELSDEPSFDVLLGMDILATGDLHVGKDGTFSFSF